MKDEIIMILLVACNMLLVANFVRGLQRDSRSNSDEE